eukprot:TRINITY_DN14831_c0_g1_i1.p1 TRINITY_DN14831_c0_g1~~TRINITY_DN14831_c0_g1_i1.p1  ORF type:complete len:492 (+),score=113.66 TRINITY_DN14831_c0_g1_i1:111-1586(+)
MFGGDNELGNILQEAVKIKSAQMGQKRRTYETWPFFVQHTLFHGEKDDLKAWRELPFSEKIPTAEELKEKGNACYAKRNWSDAIDRYEEAAGLVYYCYSTDPGWRKNNRGIDDDVLVLVDDQGTTPEEAEQHRKLRLTCALNIAACKLQLQKYDEVIAACDTSLELDANNVKALYRRAEARIRPSKSTAYDHDLAIKDLAKAHAIDPGNTTVSRLLNDLRGERRVQRSKDAKTFTGLFDRGELYDAAQLAAAEHERERSASGNTANNEMSNIQKRIDSMSDEDSLETRTANAELLRDLYMRNGKEEEARELNEKIKVAKQALKEREKPSFDWDNPSKEMIEDAKKYDLDLEDPLVIEELKRLSHEDIAGGLAAEDGAEGGAASSSTVPPPGYAEASSSGCSASLQVPVADDDVQIPWHRYFIFFGLMFLAFRFVEARSVARVLAVPWRTVSGRVGRYSFVDEYADEDRVGFFAASYKYITSFWANEDDGEL